MKHSTLHYFKFSNVTFTRDAVAESRTDARTPGSSSLATSCSLYVLKSFPSALLLVFLALPFVSGETNCYSETRITRKNKHPAQKIGTWVYNVNSFFLHPFPLLCCFHLCNTSTVQTHIATRPPLCAPHLLVTLRGPPSANVVTTEEVVGLGENYVLPRDVAYRFVFGKPQVWISVRKSTILDFWEFSLIQEKLCASVSKKNDWL